MHCTAAGRSLSMLHVAGKDVAAAATAAAPAVAAVVVAMAGDAAAVTRVFLAVSAVRREGHNAVIEELRTYPHPAW